MNGMNRTRTHPAGMRGAARDWLPVAAGVVLLVAAAKVEVPFHPVPLTLQSMLCVALGLALGPARGAAAALAYLGLGAAGLPVFAGTPEKGIGLAYMMGPTGGYLVGFVLCAAATGWLARRGWDTSRLRLAAAGAAGLVLLYLPGLAWLGALSRWDQPILEWGLWPFLPGEALKLTLVALCWPVLRGLSLLGPSR